MPALSLEMLTLLVLIAAGLSGVLGLLLLVLALRLRRLRRANARLVADGAGRDLLATVSRHLDAIDAVHGRMDVLAREVADLRQRAAGYVRRVGFITYDAFPPMGGKLSFSAAFLDDAGDGMVLSSINGRTETRSYAKPVVGGRSDHSLSEEERQVIAMAMGDGRIPVAQPAR